MNKKLFRIGKLRKNFFLVIVILVALLVFMVARSKYHASSLDTDEGQYAYGAQEILRGRLLYKDFHVNKPPGTIWVYVLVFKLFGESTFAIKLSVTIAILATSVFVFLITKKILGSFLAGFTLSFFLFSLSLPIIQSGQANSEVYMTFFIVASVYAILVSRRGLSVFISGFLLGIAFMIKTVTISNFAAVALWIFVFEKDRRLYKLLYFALGFIFSSLLILTPLYYQNILREFWFSVYLVNKKYVARVPFFVRMFLFQQRVLAENFAMWLFGLGGVVLVFKNKFTWVKQNLKLRLKKPEISGSLNKYISKKHGELFMLAMNLIFSLLLIQFIGRSWSHYYIQLVPFLSIFCIYCSFYFYKKEYLREAVIILFVISIYMSYYVSLRVVYNTPGKYLQTKIVAADDRGGWYDDSKQLSKYINKFTKPGDYMYNLGREGQLYFYTNTRSPTRYLNDRLFHNYPETFAVVCQDLRINRPKLIVNTLTEPYFKPGWGEYIWERVKKCGDLKIEKKEKYLFAEIWWIE